MRCKRQKGTSISLEEATRARPENQNTRKPARSKRDKLGASGQSVAMRNTLDAGSKRARDGRMRKKKVTENIAASSSATAASALARRSSPRAQNTAAVAARPIVPSSDTTAYARPGAYRARRA
eukprot:scaffold187933_cov29-Tisochrysis_lutea.AAC.2